MHIMLKSFVSLLSFSSYYNNYWERIRQISSWILRIFYLSFKFCHFGFVYPEAVIIEALEFRVVRQSVQLLSCVPLFGTLWTAACQASLSITNSRSLLSLMSIESVMPSNHLILCRPLLPLLSIFPSIRIFSNESVLPIRWPKYWSFSFSISPSS